MTDHALLDELQHAIDQAFHGRDRVPLREVYVQVSDDVHLPADMMTHLNELPEGEYTRQELMGAINDVIRSRGEQDSIGLLGVPAQRTPVEETPEAERAVENEAPLGFLTQTPPGPDEDNPDFREPGA
ncbi:hypothetical protein [Nonomuraea pusilla]|uniref:Uncharacterized protein n=1 Tax=Nonomuraea pusilla TaxID=46177 RepID=A0A1H8HVP4_9ACTN|nr:hypothetical protein [Nonomuraea pusilla]SEN59966.1 hypothetical protein SAMN05660976_07904 [Nonomuraea pusilla]